MKNILLLFCLPFLALLACRSNSAVGQEAPPATAEAGPGNCCYDQADLQKLRWLEGAWQATEAGRSLRLLFQFQDDETLEVLDFDRPDGATTSVFSWHAGRYYFGPNRQWKLTWTGDKDVRLDPAVAGADPMTWTRLDDNHWHLVRHTPRGDETVMFERAEEMQP